MLCLLNIRQFFLKLKIHVSWIKSNKKTDSLHLLHWRKNINYIFHAAHAFFAFYTIHQYNSFSKLPLSHDVLHFQLFSTFASDRKQFFFYKAKRTYSERLRADIVWGRMVTGRRELFWIKGSACTFIFLLSLFPLIYFVYVHFVKFKFYG